MTKLVFALLLVLAAVIPAYGQGGYIGIFGDPNGYDCGLPDLVVALETYYIVHLTTLGATACQFWAPRPPCMMAIYLADVRVFPVTIGDSQTGVSIGYGSCLEAPIHVLSIQVITQGQTFPCCCYFIYPHPSSTSGEVEVVDCEDNIVPAYAGWGYFNPDYITCGCWISAPNSGADLYGCINDPIPVEDVTWGRVKSLYSR